ncbi:TetR/AcrR family transcriptional regulator [Nonomuraea maritima]|nr:TetR/AcrR family transcriptional regulator [Nonomuraea maritima]
MTTRRVRARRGEGAMLREELLRAADDLLAESGTEDALTIRAVAARAGVSTPAVYMHFADKEALVEAVCMRVWGELQRIFSQSREGDPFLALGGCARAYMRFALDHPVQYRVLMMRPSAAQAVPPAAAAEAFGYMVDAVEACMRTGVFEGDATEIALGLWSALHGSVALVLAQPSLPWPEHEALIDRAVRVAGFGTVLYSRLPGELPPSEDLAAHADAFGAALTTRPERDQPSP